MKDDQIYSDVVDIRKKQFFRHFYPFFLKKKVSSNCKILGALGLYDFTRQL